LAQRVPSEPVTTQDGAHLFWVQSSVEARKFEFEDVRTSILEEVMSQRRVDQLQEAAAARPQPEPRFVPSREEALQLLRLGDPATVVLRLGDFSLTVAQLQEILQTERRMLGAKQVADLPFQVLYEVRDREVIYQHLRAGDEDGTGRDSVPEEQFRRARDKELVQYYARRKMISWIERRADLVREQYENNRMRFASRLRVGLRWLVIPTGEDGPAVMAQLEAAKTDLDRGTLQLEDLATSYGGEVKDLGVVSAAQVQSFAPRAMRFVFLLKPGEHSPPYASGESLVMFQVTERQDPQPQALALVRDEVVQDYLTHHAPGIFQELTDEMLQAAEFRVYHERLVGFGPVAPTFPGRP